MSAVEIARLANIALAEIGYAPTVEPAPCAAFPMLVESFHPLGNDVLVSRAVLLAKLRVQGAWVETTCDAHAVVEGGETSCALVSVADALRGRLCLNAGVS